MSLNVFRGVALLSLKMIEVSLTITGPFAKNLPRELPIFAQKAKWLHIFIWFLSSAEKLIEVVLETLYNNVGCY